MNIFFCRITFLGTSAKWITVMEDRGLKPGMQFV